MEWVDPPPSPWKIPQIFLIFLFNPSLNDIENAKDLLTKYKDKVLSKDIHLIPSVTSPNLQQPENNSRILQSLEKDYPDVFGWAGEINVYKHALAANGFLNNGNRVNEEFIKSGALDSVFKRLETLKWPTTLHCDLGCDNYDSVPFKAGRGALAFRFMKLIKENCSIYVCFESSLIC